MDLPTSEQDNRCIVRAQQIVYIYKEVDDDIKQTPERTCASVDWFHEPFFQIRRSPYFQDLDFEVNRQ